MKHSSSLRHAMILAYGSVLFFAFIILLIYSIVSPQLFAKNKVEDLVPKGRIIAGYVESTLNGEISSGYLVPLIGRSTSQWEATVWVVDVRGETLIRTQMIEGRSVGRLPQSLANAMLPSVLNGKTAQHIGILKDITKSSLETQNSSITAVLGQIDSTNNNLDEEVLRDKIVAVAVPIVFNQDVVGAVFMVQTMKEVMNSVRALNNTIILSMLFVALLLLPAILYFATQISKPIDQMRNTALIMANGNLNVRVDENRHDEYGELGHALNYLSSELGRTISSLQLERNRLEMLINGLSEGIIAIDTSQETILYNPAVISLLSLPSENCDLREDAPDIISIFDEAKEKNTAIRRTIWRGEIALHISVTPISSNTENSSGCVGIISDVTSAERLEQTRKDYVANVTHELRTPLTAMRALIEPLRDGLIKTDIQRQQIYDIVLRETMRLSRLVSDMLELSRLQTGTVSMEISIFNPIRLLETIRDTYSPYAEDYQQTFVYDVPSYLPSVRGNPDRTQQVLIALLDNAFKYTPEGGIVTLHAVQKDNIVYVSVKDTGIGISEEDQQHVFERFYKADKSHSGPGTGLGLAIAYEIMQYLGEQLTVTSAAGEGSCFTFTLHCADTEPVLLQSNTSIE